MLTAPILIKDIHEGSLASGYLLIHTAYFFAHPIVLLWMALASFLQYNAQPWLGK